MLRFITHHKIKSRKKKKFLANSLKMISTIQVKTDTDFQNLMNFTLMVIMMNNLKIMMTQRVF